MNLRNLNIKKSFLRLIGLILAAMMSVTEMLAEKSALLIGISEYPTHSVFPEASWGKVHGTNDIEIINETLKRQGFNTSILLDNEATALNIRKAFVKLSNDCNKGDLVYIHFSGHGQAYEDLSGDESDGWDEAIIPYDAMMIYKLGVYEGASHILDDELSEYLTSIRAKVKETGFVYVVLDACHMGGASRGTEQDEEEIFVRGTDQGFSSTGKKYIPRIDRRGNMKIETQGNDMSAICILEACRAYQTNTEIKENGRYYGPLTFYINQYLSQNSLTSSQSWTEQIRLLMNNDKRLIRQNMVIENSN